MITSKLLDLLLGPNPFRRDRRRWARISLRLVGPGSIPLGALLMLLSAYQAGNLETSTIFYRESPVSMQAVGVLLGIFVVMARRATVVAFLGSCAVVTWVLLYSDFSYGALTPIIDLAPILVTGFAFARAHGWLLAICLGATVPLLGSGLGLVDDTLPPSVNWVVWDLTAAALLVVDVLLIRKKYVAQRRQLAEVRRDADDERGQRRYLEERSRIGREMHDVVAHHMSMVAVKASTAEYRLHDLTEESREEFRAIAETARESLTEMRRILAVFRTDEQPELAPQPGIEQIDELCQSARASGLDVTADRCRELPELPDAVSLTAYRIVQEALSNVVRHAPGAGATVELYTESDLLAIVVMNDAGTHVPETAGYDPAQDITCEVTPQSIMVQASEAQDTTLITTSASDTRSDSGSVGGRVDGKDGLGLAGMRERVELLNGELFAEPLGRSGFLVKARLPMELVDDA